MAKVKQELEILRQKEVKVLQQDLAEAQTALQKNNVDIAFGRSTKVSTLRQLRQQVARIKTVIREKESTHA